MKATALITVAKKSGWQPVQACFSTLGILLDYKFYNDSILLKASLLHDFLEDLPEAHVDEIRWIDHDGPRVVRPCAGSNKT